MQTFRNVSPLGALEVPALGRVIDAGEEFEVRPEIAELIAGQVENFEPVSPAAKRTAKAAEKAAAEAAPGGGETIEGAASSDAEGEVTE
ncbi:hypothetical protein [Microbacterium arborescens]